MTKNEFITTAEVAEKLSVHPRTVYNWIKGKHLKASKPAGSKKWLILRTDLEKFIKNKSTN